MSLSKELERLLPRLRRFARAATADKALADDCVAVAIEQLSLSAREATEDDVVSYHFLLYRAVERVLEEKAGGSFEKQAWRALILVLVEEFSERETARILGVDKEKIRGMVASAEHQVRDVLSRDCP